MIGKLVNVNLNPVRKPGESIAAYHDRLREGKQAIKTRLRGTAIWTSIFIENFGTRFAVKHTLQGTMKKRTVSRKTKAEKKAEKKIRTFEKLNAQGAV